MPRTARHCSSKNARFSSGESVRVSVGDSGNGAAMVSLLRLSLAPWVTCALHLYGCLIAAPGAPRGRRGRAKGRRGRRGRGAGTPSGNALRTGTCEAGFGCSFQFLPQEGAEALLAPGDEEALDGVVDDGEFEVVDQDRDPGQPGRERAADIARAIGELGDDELVGDPEDMEPLRVEQQQVEERS